LTKAIVYCILITITFLTVGSSAKNTSKTMEYAELRYNSQLKAITSFFLKDSKTTEKTDYSAATRKFPAYDELNIFLTENAAKQKPKNVIIVILEGLAYKQTSLYNSTLNLTPYLTKLADECVSFENARAPVTHTTKALFSILTGRFPSVSQDFVEAIPAEKNYASLATILRDKLGYRTAFFQSALGSFEARPGLVYNLGFDTFWARNDLNDPNKYLGYLASDEFAIIEPVTDWLRQDNKPFLLTLLCSVTHDPYEVPEWFDSKAKEPLERYRQTIRYTDSFIKALDKQLAKLNLTEDTIFCVVGDHGEAFGEHGRFGHARIPFDEGLRIVWLMRTPGLTTAGKKITVPTSSIDVTPTILSAMGFNIASAGFDGTDMLNNDGMMRKLFFSAWMNQAPAGFVQGDKKYIYDPINDIVIVYNLRNDPDELSPKEITGRLSIDLASEITDWRNSCIIPLTVPEQMQQKHLFGKWLCRWKNREPMAVYTSPNLP
ncbi:MAG: sulfatase-like hydrolase/transferase, partial [Planctomycetes bacterium]|nr:sulfatase-like hydrolase/transferase [Planctomycetota bacterium]